MKRTWQGLLVAVALVVLAVGGNGAASAKAPTVAHAGAHASIHTAATDTITYEPNWLTSTSATKPGFTYPNTMFVADGAYWTCGARGGDWPPNAPFHARATDGFWEDWGQWFTCVGKAAKPSLYWQGGSFWIGWNANDHWSEAQYDLDSYVNGNHVVGSGVVCTWTPAFTSQSTTTRNAYVCLNKTVQAVNGSLVQVQATDISMHFNIGLERFYPYSVLSQSCIVSTANNYCQPPN